MYQVASWHEVGLWHGICDRNVDVSQGYDVWRQSFSNQTLFLLNQVHGTEIVDVPTTSEKANMLLSLPPDADAWVGNIGNVPSGYVFGIKTADCAPVLMFSKSSGFFVVAHCGWKSAVSHLCARCIELATKRGVDIPSLEIVIAPCASVKNYEIGKDVQDALMEWRKEFDVDESVINGSLGDKGGVLEIRGNRAYLNLLNLLKIEAISCGVKENNIKALSICTIENENYFSVRREQMQCGRQVTFIGKM